MRIYLWTALRIYGFERGGLKWRFFLPQRPAGVFRCLRAVERLLSVKHAEILTHFQTKVNKKRPKKHFFWFSLTCEILSRKNFFLLINF